MIDEDVTHRIKTRRLKWRSVNGVLGDRRIPTKVKGMYYRITIRSAMLYGSEYWLVKVQHIHNISVAEMWMLRWMCGHTKLDKIKNDYIRQKVQVARIEDKMHRLRWFEHVLCWPINAPVRRCEIMVSEGVKREWGRLKFTWKEVIWKTLQLLSINTNLTKDGAQ